MKPDSFRDGTDEFVGARVSSCIEAGTYDRGPGRVRADPDGAFGGTYSVLREGAAI